MNDQQIERLEAITLLSQTFSIIFAKFPVYRRLLSVPIIVTAALYGILGYAYQDIFPELVSGDAERSKVVVPQLASLELWGNAISLVIGVMMISVLVAIQRIVLIDKDERGPAGMRWGKREFKVLGYGVFFLLAYLVSTTILGFVMVGVGLILHELPWLIYIIFLILGLTFCMVLLRFGLVIPALAIDRPTSGFFDRFSTAWRMSDPNPWRLVGAYVLLSIATIIPMMLFMMVFATSMSGGFGLGGLLVFTVIILLFSFVVVALFATMLALAYQRFAAMEAA